MVRHLKLLLLLITLCQIGATCEGTECGNPGACPTSTGDTESETTIYSNEEFGVSGEYDGSWNYTESESSTRASDAGDTDSQGSPTPASVGGIDTSNAPRTEFTDGKTVVTIFFVTLEDTPTSLLTYLNEVFPTRSVRRFANSYLSGYTYDNVETGETGGDRQEYYFLQELTLLWVVTDLFDENDGAQKFQTLINSLRF